MINEALRLIRVFHDLKQGEAAMKLGVSKSFLCELESGRKSPTLELLGKYEKSFDIPVSSILFFSENLNETDAASKGRQFVAKKIINMLNFIESRAGLADAT